MPDSFFVLFMISFNLALYLLVGSAGKELYVYCYRRLLALSM